MTTRNGNQGHFQGIVMDKQTSGQTILRDLPISNNTNLQKSGEIHSKVDRQNSFTMHS